MLYNIILFNLLFCMEWTNNSHRN